MIFDKVSMYLEKVRSPVAFFIIFVLAFVAWVRSNPRLFVRGESYLSDWKYTHFLFDYGEGFVKRGFVGSFFSEFSSYTSYSLVNIFSYLVLFIMMFVFCVLFSKAWVQRKDQLGAFLLMAVAIMSPATIQHFALDVGRFDLIIYIIFIITLFVISKIADKSAFVTSIFVLSSLFISILIHEAAFFMVAPLIFVFWFFVSSNFRSSAFQSAVLLLVFVFTYLVSTKGGYNALPLEEHFNELKGVYGERVTESSLNVIHNTTVEDNLKRTLMAGLTWKRLIHHLVFLFFMAPLFVFLYCIFYRIKGCLDFKSKLLLLSAFSPLALYPLGHDHFRWWSLTLTNVFIVLTFIILRDRLVSDIVFDFVEKHRRMAVFVIFVGLISGPIGITGSFDLLSYASKAASYIF